MLKMIWIDGLEKFKKKFNVNKSYAMKIQIKSLTSVNNPNKKDQQLAKWKKVLPSQKMQLAAQCVKPNLATKTYPCHSVAPLPAHNLPNKTQFNKNVLKTVIILAKSIPNKFKHTKSQLFINNNMVKNQKKNQNKKCLMKSIANCKKAVLVVTLTMKTNLK